MTSTERMKLAFQLIEIEEKIESLPDCWTQKRDEYLNEMFELSLQMESFEDMTAIDDIIQKYFSDKNKNFLT